MSKKSFITAEQLPQGMWRVSVKSGSGTLLETTTVSSQEYQTFVEWSNSQGVPVAEVRSSGESGFSEPTKKRRRDDLPVVPIPSTALVPFEKEKEKEVETFRFSDPEVGKSFGDRIWNVGAGSVSGAVQGYAVGGPIGGVLGALKGAVTSAITELTLQDVKKISNSTLGGIKALTTRFTKENEITRQTEQQLIDSTAAMHKHLDAVNQQLVDLISKAANYTPTVFDNKVATLLQEIQQTKASISESAAASTQIAGALNTALVAYQNDANTKMNTLGSMFQNASLTVNDAKGQIALSNQAIVAATQELNTIRATLKQREEEYSRQMTLYEQQNRLITTSEATMKGNQQAMMQLREQYAAEVTAWQAAQRAIITGQEQHMQAIQALQASVLNQNNSLVPAAANTRDLIALNEITAANKHNNELMVTRYNALEKQLLSLSSEYENSQLIMTSANKDVVAQITSLANEFGQLRLANNALAQTNMETQKRLSSSLMLLEQNSKDLAIYSSNYNQALATIQGLQEEMNKAVVPFDYDRIKREIVLSLPKQEPQLGIVEIDYDGINNSVSMLIAAEGDKREKRMIKLEEALMQYPNMMAANNKAIMEAFNKQIVAITENQNENNARMLRMLEQQRAAPLQIAAPGAAVPPPPTASFVYFRDLNLAGKRTELGAADLVRARNYTSLAGQKRRGNKGHALVLTGGSDPDPFINPEFHVNKARTVASRRKARAVQRAQKSTSSRIDTLF